MDPLIRSLFRYTMVGIIFLYALPTILFTIFRKGNHIVEALLSTPSFIFYSQTYLNSLNIFAHCKIDDVSWGTKGLDSNTLRDASIMEEWKKLKIIHTLKFVFYNILVGFIFVLASNFCILEIWLPLFFLFVLGFTLFIRVFLGSIYIITYKCKSKGLTSERI